MQTSNLRDDTVINTRGYGTSQEIKEPLLASVPFYHPSPQSGPERWSRCVGVRSESPDRQCAASSALQDRQFWGKRRNISVRRQSMSAKQLLHWSIPPYRIQPQK
ncbi:hypothetical protein XPA_006039 [Xanthoria parietina]